MTLVFCSRREKIREQNPATSGKAAKASLLPAVMFSLSKATQLQNLPLEFLDKCLWQLIYTVRFCSSRKIFLNKRAQKQTTRANLIEKLVKFSNIHEQVLSSLARKTRGYCYVFFSPIHLVFIHDLSSNSIAGISCNSQLNTTLVLEGLDSIHCHSDRSLQRLARRHSPLCLYSIERVDHGV